MSRPEAILSGSPTLGNLGGLHPSTSAEMKPSIDPGRLLEPQNEQFVSLVERVYRYQFIRCGDPLKARALTRETFSQALDWLPAYREEHGSLVAWLLSLAWAVRRSRSASRLVPDRIASQNQREGGPSAEARAVRLMQAARLAESLRSVPDDQADALALHFFGGLGLPEIGAVMGMREEGARRLVIGALEHLGRSAGQGNGPPGIADSRLEQPSLPALGLSPLTGAEAQVLLDLAGDLHPDPALFDEVRTRLAAQAARPAHAGRFPPRLPPWQTARLGRSAARISRVAVPILIGGFLLAALLRSPVLTGSTRMSTPTGPSAKASALAQISSSVGEWVPPEIEVCQEWQGLLSKLLGRSVELAERVPYVNGGGSPNDEGVACELSASGSGEELGAVEETIRELRNLLEADGYEPGQIFIRRLGPLYEALFAESYYGRAQLFRANGRQAILTTRWRPSDPDRCSPYQNETSCDLPDSERVHTISLRLSADRVRPLLRDFLARWEDNDAVALDLLSEDLRQRLPGLADLDQLAGIGRSLARPAHFSDSWQTTQNAPGLFRVKVQAFQPANMFRPARFLPVLELVLEAQGDDWRISQINPEPVFPATEDFLILASPERQVYRYDPDTEQRVNLTTVGFYQPSSNRGSDTTDLSPDGQTLYLDTPTGGAWLVFLDGRTPVRLEEPSSPFPDVHSKPAWSPDGSRLAAAFADQPDQIVLLDPAHNPPLEHVLARLEGPVIRLAWSPDGQRLAAIHTAQNEDFNDLQYLFGSQEDIPIFSLSLVNVDSGAVESNLFVSPPLGEDSRKHSLIWTADSREVHYDPISAAYNLNERFTRPLVRPPASGQTAATQDALLTSAWMRSATGQEYQLSPDGSSLAVGYRRNEEGKIHALQVQTAAEQPVIHWSRSIQPTDRILWTSEGESLILGSNPWLRGLVYRANSKTGETVPLIEDTYLIGTSFDLGPSTRQDRTASQTTPLPEPGPVSDWETFHVSGDWVSFRYPADWHVFREAGQSLNQITLSSVEFFTPFQVASLPPGSVFFEITRSYSTSIADEVREIEGGSSGSVMPWVPVRVAGRSSFRINWSEVVFLPDYYIIPTQDYWVQILHYQTGPGDDAVFNQILQSMVLED